MSTEQIDERFDYARFERLKGLDLGMYYAKWSERHTVGPDFFEYFRSKAASFDDEHLQYALGLIGKTSSMEAFHEIAKFMRHSCASVRLFAINTISHLPSIDNVIMPYVISTLANPVDSLGIRELCEAAKRSNNAKAKALAEEYLSSVDKSESPPR